MIIKVVAFSTNGCRTALRIKESFPEEDIELFAKTKCDTLGIQRIEGKTSEWTGEMFKVSDAIVFIGATGIAVRYIAPYVKSKTTDPAIISMDEHGRWCIALLAGHIGGANALTERIATHLGSEPIITTATDLNGKFSVDTFATVNGLRIMSMKLAQDISVGVLNDEFVGLSSDIDIGGDVPKELTVADEGPFGISISSDPEKKPFDRTLRLITMDIVLGIGCKRDTDPEKLKGFVLRMLEKEGIAKERIAAICSIDLKKDEEAILSFARFVRSPAMFYTSEQLMSLEGEFSKSEFVKSVTTVDCVCERSAMMPYGGELVLKKTAENGMTLAICKRRLDVKFP